MFEKKMYINGKLIDSPFSYDVLCPATDKLVSSVFIADKNIAQDALVAAESAKKKWAQTSKNERVKWMLRLRDAVIENEDALRKAVHLETGKVWGETKEDVDSLSNSLAFYADIIHAHKPTQIVDKDGTHTHQLSYEPAGVVVAYLAWNFPLLNLAFKIGPAMASGCPIILKPSLKTSLSAYIVGKLCCDIGLPSGVVNIISGEDSEICDFMSSSEIPSVLTLIGSTATGLKIMKSGSSTIKKYSMELGGNAPFIVYKDADLDLASSILTSLKYSNCGQICVTPNRVFVEKSIEKQFTKLILDKTKNIKYGFEDDSNMGSMIDKDARSRVHKTVEEAIEQGADLLTGGILPTNSVGAFYPPTVLSNTTDNMSIHKKEIFGPVIVLSTFDTQEEVVSRSNDTNSGLTAYVFTKDTNKAQSTADLLEFGEVQINGVKYGIDLPHVGIKQSGVGCDCSSYALDDYSVLKRTTAAL
ncbi:aldehyde dehydrogenase family protein [Marinomonas flavescens]|uniref:aldehyde dehydrogenase family protein n=1 Tax=Marinomonas flavescens TaxID=2529379 RepID=UPI0010551D88|nr:aldehyde dehydrogenase family protein [Marinomonas flavescens]